MLPPDEFPSRWGSVNGCFLAMESQEENYICLHKSNAAKCHRHLSAILFIKCFLQDPCNELVRYPCSSNQPSPILKSMASGSTSSTLHQHRLHPSRPLQRNLLGLGNPPRCRRCWTATMLKRRSLGDWLEQLCLLFLPVIGQAKQKLIKHSNLSTLDNAE